MSEHGGRLLIEEPPLQVLPSLAAAIGLNEALVVQQVHFWLWLKRQNNDLHFYRAGRWWVAHTYASWREQFRFWSKDTIKRTIRSAENQGLLDSSDQYNLSGMDRTKWYSVNYQSLGAICTPRRCNLHPSSVQSAPTNTGVQSAPPKPDTTKEIRTTTEIPSVDGAVSECVLVLEAIARFPKDRSKVVPVVAELVADYPHVDAVALCKKFRNYCAERRQPYKRPLTALTNWFQNERPRANGSPPAPPAPGPAEDWSRGMEGL